MINARIETLAEKPAFKRALKKRRCLLPADGYYEWYPTEQRKSGKPLKQPFFIRPKDGGVMAMAGLYEIWRNKEVADEEAGRVRLVRHGDHHAAEDSVGHIHDRMPMLVEPERYAAWLDARSTTPTTSRRCWFPPHPVASRPTRWPRTSTTSATTATPDAADPAGGARRLRLRPPTTTMATTVRTISTDQGDARIPPRPSATTGRDPRPRARGGSRRGLARPGRPGGDAAAAGDLGVPDRAALARRRQEGRGTSRGSRRGHPAVHGRDPGPHAGDPRRAQRRGAGGLPLGQGARGRRLPRAGISPAPAGTSRTLPPPELVAVGVPTFVVQGERDTFGSPDAFPEDVELTAIPDADHASGCPRRRCSPRRRPTRSSSRQSSSG